MTQEERLKILEMLENGVITADQAAQLLTSLGEEPDFADQETELSVEDWNTDLLEEETSGEQPEADSADLLDELETGLEETLAEAEEELEPVATIINLPPQVPLPAPTPGSAPYTETTQPKRSSQPNLNKWRRWWVLPLSIGIVITALTGWFIYLGTVNTWAGFWMFCLWLPMLFGIALMTLAWLSQSTPWLHVRVNTGQDEWPRRIAISFPIPIRLTAWGLRTFGHFIPNIDATGLDEIIVALGQSMVEDDPIYIEVDNKGDGGEYVEVFIG